MHARHVRTAIDLALLAVLGAALLRVFAWPTLRHQYPFPVGPDVPVYLWWTRVVEWGGPALASERPGAPALVGTIAGLLDHGLVAGLGGLQYALGPAIGLAAAALARGRGRTLPRGGWLAAGVLCGAWATFLGGGYVSNLVFVAAFLAAAAALARRTWRGAIAAALLLAGGGITHPGFFAVGAIVLLGAGAWAAFHEGRLAWDTDAGRVAIALGGGVAVALLGLWSATLGGAAVPGETSTDAFLRQTGQLPALRATYLDRFLVNWRRYSPFMTTALATAGAFRAHGFARRFLLSWAAVTAGGVVLGTLTGWFPPDRILMFAFCLPMLAAFGLVLLGEKLGHWWLAWPVGILLTALIVAPAIRDWRDQQTYSSPDEVAHVTLAGRIAAARSTPGTPLVFVADSTDPDEALFLLGHTANVARAAVPPDRAEDVYVYPRHAGEPGGRTADRTRRPPDRPRERGVARPDPAGPAPHVRGGRGGPRSVRPRYPRPHAMGSVARGLGGLAGATARLARRTAAGRAAQDPCRHMARVPALAGARARLVMVGAR